MRWHTSLKKSILDLVPARYAPHLRSLAAGFAFGGVLFVFAFGSMGMSNPQLSRLEPAWEPSQASSEFASPQTHRSDRNSGSPTKTASTQRGATQADLVRMGNLLIEAFSPAVDADGWKLNRQALSDSFKYLQSLEQTPEDLSDIPLKRADVTIFFYRLIADLFEPELTENSYNQYADIPRYHYMNMPVEILDRLGIKLAREESCFGPEDQVSMEWLSTFSMNLVKCFEERLNSKVFQPVETRK